jgi:hypothetical protein
MMLSRTVLENIDKSLDNYRHNYLINKFNNLNEASTKLIINHLITDVLGYSEIEDIRAESSVASGYMDYVIKLDDHELIVVEVKSIKTKLSNRHLSQAITYAAIAGLEWIILTNAGVLELYRVEFDKPMRVTKVFALNLARKSTFDTLALGYLTKRSVENGGLDKLWRLSQKQNH